MQSNKQIKDYRFVKELGKGANGLVRQAYNVNTNELIAIKTIPNQKLVNKRIENQLKEEMKILYHLSHKNILKIKDVQKSTSNTHLVLEYCNGGTLFEFYTYYKKTYKRRLSEVIVQKIIRQIIDGLKYMHKKNIIHRDIKLDNIMINFDDYQNIFSEEEFLNNKDLYHMYDLENCNFTIKLIDLGFARNLEGCDGATTICGTPMTIAPEIINIFSEAGKDTKYNSSIDIWSLGAVLYELMIGEAPFIGSSPEEVMRKVYTGLYNIPSNISISIESVYLLNGLLQFNPKKRLTWDQIIYHPFVTKDAKKFKFIKLNSHADNKIYNDKLIIDSKDSFNLLRILLKGSGASLPFELDELDKDTCEEIIKDILADEMTKEFDDYNEQIFDENYRHKELDENKLIQKFGKNEKDLNYKYRHEEGKIKDDSDFFLFDDKKKEENDIHEKSNEANIEEIKLKNNQNITDKPININVYKEEKKKEMFKEVVIQPDVQDIQSLNRKSEGIGNKDITVEIKDNQVIPRIENIEIEEKDFEYNLKHEKLSDITENKLLEFNKNLSINKEKVFSEEKSESCAHPNLNTNNEDKDCSPERIQEEIGENVVGKDSIKEDKNKKIMNIENKEEVFDEEYRNYIIINDQDYKQEYEEWVIVEK